MPSHSLSVGARAQLSIDRLSLGGDGVGRVGDCVAFVPYACPGDRLEIEITEARSNFVRGRIRKVLNASPQRTKPPCPYHFQVEQSSEFYCGGCSWQQVQYPAQLEAKRQLVAETLARLGGLKHIEVKPTLGMSDPWRYRNKVQQPVGWEGGRLISGFFAPFSHRIVPIEDCLVQPELSVRIINRARDLLQRFRLQAYDERSHRGWIRHLWIRTARDRAMLVFITRSPDFPREREIIEALIKEFPQLVGVHQNVNPGRTNVILGRGWRKIAGADFLEERLGPLRFLISPGSFFQVNTEQTLALYREVESMAGRGNRLLDLYCGVGSITLWLAKNFQEIGGVEESRGAVRDAERNAELNGIENVRFIAEKTEAFVHHMSAGNAGELTVVLDPPRAGCDAGVLKSLGRIGPRKIVYVSCDPGTLARDLALLHSSGYQVREVQPVDLFPHTAHIETAVQLVK